MWFRRDYNFGTEKLLTRHGQACKTKYAFIMQMMESNNEIRHLEGPKKFLARVFETTLLKTSFIPRSSNVVIRPFTCLNYIQQHKTLSQGSLAS